MLGNIFFSNCIDTLAHMLQVNITAQRSSDLFLKQQLVIPNQEIINFLALHHLKTNPSSIFFGIDYFFLNQFFCRLTEKLKNQQPFLSRLQLILLIRKACEDGLKSNDSIWEPIVNYIQDKEHRINSLSYELACLFDLYTKHGFEECFKWEKEPKNWQEKIWKNIFSKYSYPAKAILQSNYNDNFFSQKQPIHIFGFHYIAPAFFYLLEKIAKTTPVFIYFLSPCQEFWSDTPSDKQLQYLQKKWTLEGVSNIEQENFNLFIHDRNPLLANLGSVGKSTAKMIENSLFPITDLYRLPKPSNKLTALQYNIITMDSIDLISFTDDSIQIHVCFSKYSEIINVYNLTIQAIQSGILPEEISIMAPDISQYLPFISAVFDGCSTKIPYRITDIPMYTQNECTKALMQIIAFADSRWKIFDIQNLLYLKPIQNKFNLDSSNIDLFVSWLYKSKFSWGFNKEHKDAILNKKLCSTTSSSDLYTLSSSFNILLQEVLKPTLSNFISFSDSPFLGEIILLFQSLYEDLFPICNNLKQTFSSWINLFKQIIEKYLETSNKDKENLFLRLNNLIEESLICKDSLCDYKFVLKTLEDLLTQDTVTINGNYLNSVRFCSMLPAVTLRSTGVKYLFLIGMNDNDCPRQSSNNSLNLLNKKQLRFPLISPGDFDRFIFLESLLVPKNKLIISYVNNDKEDFNMSSVVSLLSKYADVSSFIHPNKNHSQSYFDNSYPHINNFSTISQKIASTIYSKKHSQQISSNTNQNDNYYNRSSNNIDISISELSLCCNNPIKIFLKYKLNIPTYSNTPKASSNKIETLSQMRKKVFNLFKNNFDIPKSIQTAKNSDVFLSGFFNSSLIQQFNNELLIMNKSIHKNTTPLTLNFIPNLIEPIVTSSSIELPAPNITLNNDVSITVYGSLKMSNHGIFLQTKKDKTSKIKRFYSKSVEVGLIQYAQSVLTPEQLNQFNLANINVFLEPDSPKSIYYLTSLPINNSKQNLLSNLCTLFYESTKNPSPLFPALISDFLNQDAEQLQKTIFLISTNQRLFNSELCQFLENQDVSFLNNLIKQWYPLAKDIYGDFIDELL